MSENKEGKEEMPKKVWIRLPLDADKVVVQINKPTQAQWEKVGKGGYTWVRTPLLQAESDICDVYEVADTDQKVIVNNNDDDKELVQEGGQPFLLPDKVWVSIYGEKNRAPHVVVFIHEPDSWRGKLVRASVINNANIETEETWQLIILADKRLRACKRMHKAWQIMRDGNCAQCQFLGKGDPLVDSQARGRVNAANTKTEVLKVELDLANARIAELETDDDALRKECGKLESLLATARTEGKQLQVKLSKLTTVCSDDNENVLEVQKNLHTLMECAKKALIDWTWTQELYGQRGHFKSVAQEQIYKVGSLQKKLHDANTRIVELNQAEEALLSQEQVYVQKLQQLETERERDTTAQDLVEKNARDTKGCCQCDNSCIPSSPLDPSPNNDTEKGPPEPDRPKKPESSWDKAHRLGYDPNNLPRCKVCGGIVEVFACAPDIGEVMVSHYCDGHYYDNIYEGIETKYTGPGHAWFLRHRVEKNSVDG